MTITDEQKREFAEELILEHAQDVEFLSVSERLGDTELDLSGLSEDEYDELCREIHDLVGKAEVTVSWPAGDAK